MKQSSPELLSSKILKWLDKQGYALEMRVAQAFDRAGFRVAISRYYVDKISNNLREIDVVASVDRHVGGMWASVDYFIECKYAPRPWVIFTSEKPINRLGYFSRILKGDYDLTHWDNRPTLQARFLARTLSLLGRGSFTVHNPFIIPKSVGYRITESLRQSDSRDSAYSALMQVTNSISAYDARIERDHERLMNDFEYRVDTVGDTLEFSMFCGLGLPIVLIKGKIFECYLNMEGEVILSEVNESIVMMSSMEDDGVARLESIESPIRIITESLLEGFASELFEASTSLLAQDVAFEDIWQHERNKLPPRGDSKEIPF